MNIQSSIMTKNHSHSSGFGYFISGVTLALSPGIRRFVFLPLLSNLLLVGSAVYYLLTHLTEWIAHWMGLVPSYLSWLSYLLWPLIALTILGTFSYFFSALANLIASPFHGLLAEKVEKKLTGQSINDEGWWALVRDTPRILLRELQKISYFLPRALLLFLILLIPVIGQTLGVILWFLFTSWMCAIQYCDYPFDNHKISFATMRSQAKQKPVLLYPFGMLVSVVTSIPILNLLIMPIAICGATALWVNEFKAQNDQLTSSQKDQQLLE